ncbi:cytochrome c5 family protein [Pseudomonas yamanorum]|uniref:c-type cytochrome n=1 Tax=Pseudomonas yamanorum TaxID=515393 RepID=UPI0015A2FFF9|nr:cytochrome c5 family protein [Pseudomonas yamanorum]NVZ86116.1 cytochrome c5 family protein [Pseudomonas yamanorum]
MRAINPRRLSLLLAVTCLLTACDDTPKHPPERATAANAMPGDAALAQVYDTSCKLCHANPASGAPLTGDTNAWSPRIAEGPDTLLDHTINGYNGMPPMGMCVQCSEEQFLGLISFMSGQHIQ